MGVDEEGGGGMYDAPNQQTVRPDGSAPWDEGEGGSVDPDPKTEAEKLPGQHAGLDELALERGVTWSRDDLTVREKQEELGG